MRKQKKFVVVTACDICGDVLKFIRISGYENYEGYGFDVCSGCCATPTIHTDEIKKINFLVEFHKKSNHLIDGIPPFWPMGDDGKAMSIHSIAAMMP